MSRRANSSSPGQPVDDPDGCQSQDSGWPGYPFPLTLEHVAQLEASAVKQETAERRGVRSVSTKTEARQLGFRGDAMLTGLYFPGWTTRGTNGGGQLRPDEPRLDTAGKYVKYETPTKQEPDSDVHRDARALLLMPDVPLVVTEGVKKSDSCYGNFGIPAISLAGVTNWHGASALASWEDVVFRSGDQQRDVYVIFTTT